MKSLLHVYRLYCNRVAFFTSSKLCINIIFPPSTFFPRVAVHRLLIQVLCSRLCSGVNELNNNGETPLHVACRLGRVEAVKALLDGGAKCDVIGGIGYPIHSAMKYSEKGLVLERVRTMIYNVVVFSLSRCLWCNC